LAAGGFPPPFHLRIRRLLPQPGVQNIAQAFTDEVVAEHGQQNRQAREHGQPRRDFQHFLAVHEDIAPARHGRLHAKAQEAEGRFYQDGAGHAEGGRDEHRGGGVGQNVVKKDARGTHAGHPGGQDEFPAAQGQGLGPDESRHPHPGGEPDDDHDIGERRREKGDNGQDEEKGRKAQHDIHAAHDALVHQPTEIAGAQSERQPDGHGQPHGHESHPERDPAAVEQSGEHIAAQGIGAQEMRADAGRHQDGVDVQGRGIERRNVGCEKRGQGNGSDKGQTGPEHAVPGKSPQQPVEEPVSHGCALPGGYADRPGRSPYRPEDCRPG